jgi:Holliday junction DNA helicase RuvA
MISYLSGKIILKKDKFIVLDVNGVGYKVFLSKKTFSKIPETGGLEVFCFLDVKETSLNLYGFLDAEELEFFEVLDNIRGVGPKAALEISSLGSLEKIKQRILSHDEKIFEGIPGIGRKKAMTIILELSGKIKNLSKEKSSTTDNAEDALVNLGFPRQKAKEALKKVSGNDEERVKQALKILGQA